MPWTGYRFDQVGHCPGRRIELNNEPLLPLLDMQGRSGVHESETAGAIHGLNDAVETHRPQIGRMSFNSDQLPRCDLGTGVQHVYPSQVELLLAAEDVARGLKGMLSVPEVGPRKVMGKS